MRRLPVPPAFHHHLDFQSGITPMTMGIAFTRRTLTAWFPRASTAACADVLLVAGELLANAAQHAGGPLALDLCKTPHGRIRITVTDASTATPRIRPLLPHIPGGHGMRIVDQLSHAWGTHPVPGGKTVWAECDPPPTITPAG